VLASATPRLRLDHPGFDGGRVIWRKIVARWVVVA
jgi:hypothetical protein